MSFEKGEIVVKIRLEAVTVDNCAVVSYWSEGFRFTGGSAILEHGGVLTISVPIPLDQKGPVDEGK